MNTLSNFSSATSESVWAILQEVAQLQKTFRADLEQTKKIVEANSRDIGGISLSNGEMAESYFVNSFTKSMQFAGQKYDEISPNLSKKIKRLNLQGEYDLVLYNCSSVVIIEIKYKANTNDIEGLLKKAPIFKQLYPQYANFDMYLGLASLHFNKNVENESIQQGVAVIKQVGENVVIYDKNLKVF